MKNFLHIFKLIGWGKTYPSISARTSAPPGNTFLTINEPHQLEETCLWPLLALAKFISTLCLLLRIVVAWLSYCKHLFCFSFKWMLILSHWYWPQCQWFLFLLSSIWISLHTVQDSLTKTQILPRYRSRLEFSIPKLVRDIEIAVIKFRNGDIQRVRGFYSGPSEKNG